MSLNVVCEQIILWSELNDTVKKNIATYYAAQAGLYMACIPLPLLLGGEVAAVCHRAQLATLCL